MSTAAETDASGTKANLQRSLDYLSDVLGDIQRLEEGVESAVEVCVRALSAGKVLLACGNGGSMAEAQHLVGELVSTFLDRDRGALPAITLGSSPATASAWANDHRFETGLAREFLAFRWVAGALVAFSTSGRSTNVLLALNEARLCGVPIIVLTSHAGREHIGSCEVLLAVPDGPVHLVQHAHQVLMHAIAHGIEQEADSIITSLVASS